MKKTLRNSLLFTSLILTISCQVTTNVSGQNPSSSSTPKPVASNTPAPAPAFGYVGMDGDKTQKDFDIAKPDGENDLHFVFTYDFGKETNVQEIVISRIGEDGKVSQDTGWSTNAARNFWVLYLESQGKFIISRNESSFKLSGVMKIDAYGSGNSDLSSKNNEYQLDIIDTDNKTASLRLKI
jgi:hypothetical protein